MKLAETPDRVRENTSSDVNQQIDDETAHRVRIYATAGSEAISRRLQQLDREWDMERILQTNAATLALTGTLLGATLSRRWLVLPLAVTGFLLQHALQGWCPPVAPLRRLGVRTRPEIERERYALKVLRGDFKSSSNGGQPNPGDVLAGMDL